MQRDDLVSGIKPLDTASLHAARLRHDQLTKPPGSLGHLETLGIQLAGIYGTPKPVITGKGVAVFAADHGVTDEGVSAYPKTVTEQMVLNFLRGGAAVNVLARVADAQILIVDVGVDADVPNHPNLRLHKVRRGTRNMLHEPAMTEAEVHTAMRVGSSIALQLIDSGLDLLAGGEMGIGNTTAAAAITAAMTGRPVRAVTGRGTGLQTDRLDHKIRVIEAALAKHRISPHEPWQVLAAVGGLEIAALAGFYLAAASRGVPVLLDGFITTAAALIATSLEPNAKEYLIASHVSQEPGHRLQLEHLGLRPIFDLDMRLGEASGAVLAMHVVESAARVLSDMATFHEAGVSGAA